MHSHSWRLLVAGHLHLDSQLRELSSASAQDDHHDIIRDATLDAFELLIESALEHSADLLLLTGSLCEKTPTLRACTVFRDGVETLLEEGIAVAWTPPDHREVELLRKINCLPAGLKILHKTAQSRSVQLDADRPGTDSPAIPNGSVENTVSHSGKTRFGTVCCELISERASRRSNETANSQTTYIGLTDQPIGHLPQKETVSDLADEKYQLIISGQSPRCRTIRHRNRLYHSPGVIQSLTNDITGLCSATLIEIDSQGEIELTPLPVSPVVREKIELGVSEETALDELLEQAERELLGLLSNHSYSPAKLMQLRWEVRGPHSFVIPFASADLQELLSPLQPLEEIFILHDVALIPQLTGVKIEGRDLQEKYLGEQFLQFLGNQNTSNKKNENGDALKKLESHSPMLKKVLAELNHSELCHRAAELGLLALQGELEQAG